LSGSCPAGTDEQTPSDPASAHDAQIPVLQAVEQQTPCAQKFELHIAAAVQAAPLGNLPQLMFTQLLGDTQSVAVLVQVVLQAVAEPHWYGSHNVLVTDRQTPAPSQVRCGVSVEPTQVPAAHCVPLAQKRHAPMPLHMPSSPHDVAAVAAHWLAGEGAVPLATLLHRPRLPAIAHDLHGVSHAWLQQYPCAQKLEAHSPAAVHAAPLGLSVQMLALQMLGATQSVAAVVQLVRQAPVVVSQVYFPHGLDVAAPQTPAPLQVRADKATVELEHIGAAHWVPLTCLRHAPAPSQLPSLPHVDAAAAGHCEATSGGAPGPIGEHVPTLPVSEHDMQVPVQALLQQTLLTQNPESQSELTPLGQAPPMGILPQLLLTHVLPLVHWDVAVQVVRHAVVLQV
jgi:hypothetical protein